MTDDRLVAIHQPNFFPWLGYFDKIARADVFVLMDNVQFPRTGGGNWLNRVQLMVSGRPAWATMPVDRSRGALRISEMKIDDAGPWRQKLARTLEMSYARAPFFRELLPQVREWLNRPTTSLAEFNEANIRAVAELLGLDTRGVVRGTELEAGGASTELLIAMTRAAGGSAYLCGSGSAKYQDDVRFEQEGLGVVHQKFVHPVYPQAGGGEFVPGLSVLDALFNLGPEGTRALLHPHGAAPAPAAS